MSDVNNFAYSDKVKEHFLHPLNFLMGDESKYEHDAEGIVGNPICGDQMKMYLQIKDGRIVDVKWKTYGCASAIASTSALSELAKGKTLDEALEIGPEEITEFLGGLPKHKFHCSVLGHEALAAAIENYKKKPGDADCSEWLPDKLGFRTACYKYDQVYGRLLDQFVRENIDCSSTCLQVE